MSQPFTVGITRDFLNSDGRLSFGDIGLSLLNAAPGVRWEYLAESAPELSAEQVSEYDALLLLGSTVTEATLNGGGPDGSGRLAIVARFGVGHLRCPRMSRRPRKECALSAAL